MRYQHIVFDIDETLINTEDAILHSLQDTLEECIHEKVPIKQLLFVMGITGEDALRQLKINNIPLSLKLWEENIKKYSNTITVYDGIQELLNSLSECDCKIGIVTSKTKAEFKDDFALAMWGSHTRELEADYFIETPNDLLGAIK